MKRKINTRVNDTRNTGLVTNGNKLLVLKLNSQAYTIPSLEVSKKDPDNLEKDEKTKKLESDLLVKEVEKLTGVIARLPALMFELNDFYRDNYDSFYVLEYVSGEPKENADGSKAEWVDIDDFKSLDLLPLFAKEWVIGAIFRR